MSEYTGALRRAIVAYKYGGDRHWAEPFARLLLRFLDQHATWFEEYEVLCPAPSFTGPNARRLWAPVETVCAALARLADQSWPVETLLIKVVETQPAVGKKGPERRAAAASLRAALTVPSAAIVRGSRVLLIDDVCTSGGTLLAMATTLRAAGVDEVAALVLARASWRGKPLPHRSLNRTS